jgi:RNA recognition motif-containing protein
LVKVFSQFGHVERAFTLFNHKSNTSRGFGFVEFSTEEAASKVIGKRIFIEGKEVIASKALERTKGVIQFLPRKNHFRKLTRLKMLQSAQP